jgi:hypothetical protein
MVNIFIIVFIVVIIIIYIHIFLTSVLVGSELSVSRPGKFIPGKEPAMSLR